MKRTGQHDQPIWENGPLREANHALYRACPSFSLSREGERFSSQPLYVAQGRNAKEASVLAIEVGGVLVADTIGRCLSIEVFAQHQKTSFLEPQPFLELQGTHRRDLLEVVVQPG